MERTHTITEREFQASVARDVAANRSRDFLESAGYRLRSNEPLQLERGSVRGTPFALSPKKWHAVAGVTFTGKPEAPVVKARFQVDTTGQMVTVRESRFWESEIDSLVAAVKGETTPVIGHQGANAAAASRDNARSIGVMLLCVLVTVAVTIGVILVMPRSMMKPLRFILPAGSVAFWFWLWSRFQKRLDRKAMQEGENDRHRR